MQSKTKNNCQLYFESTTGSKSWTTFSPGEELCSTRKDVKKPAKIAHCKQETIKATKMGPEEVTQTHQECLDKCKPCTGNCKSETTCVYSLFRQDLKSGKFMCQKMKKGGISNIKYLPEQVACPAGFSISTDVVSPPSPPAVPGQLKCGQWNNFRGDKVLRFLIWSPIECEIRCKQNNCEVFYLSRNFCVFYKSNPKGPLFTEFESGAVLCSSTFQGIEPARPNGVSGYNCRQAFLFGKPINKVSTAQTEAECVKECENTPGCTDARLSYTTPERTNLKCQFFSNDNTQSNTLKYSANEITCSTLKCGKWQFKGKLLPQEKVVPISDAFLCKDICFRTEGCDVYRLLPKLNRCELFNSKEQGTSVSYEGDYDEPLCSYTYRGIPM